MRNIVETRLTARVERWPFEKPFRITGYEWTESEVLVVEARAGDLVGRGEALGVYYLNDTPEHAKAQIEALAAPYDAAQLPAGGARNALDCALWDLRAKIERKPVWQLLGLPEPKPLRTTYTVGAGDPAAMAETARSYAKAHALKLKLTGEGDAERVLAVRAARRDVWLGVDANQGFHSANRWEHRCRCSKNAASNSSNSRSRSAVKPISTDWNRRFRSLPTKASRTCRVLQASPGVSTS